MFKQNQQDNPIFYQNQTKNNFADQQINHKKLFKKYLTYQPQNNIKSLLKHKIKKINSDSQQQQKQLRHVPNNQQFNKYPHKKISLNSKPDQNDYEYLNQQNNLRQQNKQKYFQKYLLRKNLTAIQIQQNQNHFKNDRNQSLKAYLHRKQSMQKQQYLEHKLPKIGKSQNIISIIQNQINQQKQNKKNFFSFSKNQQKQKQKHKSKSIRNIIPTKQHENQNQQSAQIKNPYYHLMNKHRSQRVDQNAQIYHSIDAKSNKKLPSLLPFGDLQTKSKKMKIQLMGKKLKPVERDVQNKTLNFLQNRMERIQKGHHLLSSQLIYKSRKQHISKSVYQQIVRKIFNS